MIGTKPIEQTLGELAPYRPDGECWNWRGSLCSNGYGDITREGNGQRVHILAHRAAYEVWVGPIPKGMTLDHTCSNRCCVNPEHLEPVTRGENARRGQGWKDGRCKRGHPLTPENIYTARTNGKHQCRACWTSRRTEKRSQ